MVAKESLGYCPDHSQIEMDIHARSQVVMRPSLYFPKLNSRPLDVIIPWNFHIIFLILSSVYDEKVASSGVACEKIDSVLSNKEYYSEYKSYPFHFLTKRLMFSIEKIIDDPKTQNT